MIINNRDRSAIKTSTINNTVFLWILLSEDMGEISFEVTWTASQPEIVHSKLAGQAAPKEEK